MEEASMKTFCSNHGLISMVSRTKCNKNQKQSSRGILRKRCSENMQQSYMRTPVFSHTSAWVFSCKFAACFQNTFSWDHLWMAASKKSRKTIVYSMFSTLWTIEAGLSDFHEMIVTVTKTSNRIIKLMLLRIPVTSRGFEMQTSNIH